MGSLGRGVARRGTGEVASIRAGFRMIGRDIGGTPTCSGEARGCRMSGGCAVEGGMSVTGLVFTDTGVEKEGDPGVPIMAGPGTLSESVEGKNRTLFYSGPA